MPEAKENGTGANVIAGLVIMGLQWLIREAPGAYGRIVTLVNKPDPTDADFEDAKAQISSDSFDKLVPNAAKFPKPQTSTQPPQS